MSTSQSAALDTHIADHIIDFLNIFTIIDIYTILTYDDYFYEKTYLALLDNLNYKSNCPKQFIIHSVDFNEVNPPYQLLKINNFKELTDLLHYLETIDSSTLGQDEYDFPDDEYEFENSIKDPMYLEIYGQLKELCPNVSVIASNIITNAQTYYHAGFTTQVKFLEKLNFYAEQTQTPNLIHTIEFLDFNKIELIKLLITANYELKFDKFTSLEVFQYLVKETNYFDTCEIVSILNKVTSIKLFEYIIENHISDINQVLNQYDINLYQNLFVPYSGYNFYSLKYLVNLGFDLIDLDFSKINLSIGYKPLNRDTLKYVSQFNLSQENLLILYFYTIQHKFADDDSNLFWDKLDIIDLSQIKLTGSFKIPSKQVRNILVKINNPIDIFNLINSDYLNFKLFEVADLDYLYDNYFNLHSLITHYLLKYLIFHILNSSYSNTSRGFELNPRQVKKSQSHLNLLTKYQITISKSQIRDICSLLKDEYIFKINNFEVVCEKFCVFFEEFME